MNCEVNENDLEIIEEVIVRQSTSTSVPVVKSTSVTPSQSTGASNTVSDRCLSFLPGTKGIAWVPAKSNTNNHNNPINVNNFISANPKSTVPHINMHVNGSQNPDPLIEKVTNCGCRRNCLSVFSEKEKLEILKKFRRIEEREDQDQYLKELMEVFPIKRRRLRPEESTVKLRACSVNYFAKYKNRTELVCKQGFLALHGVSKKRCARILATIPKDISYDSSFEDSKNYSVPKCNSTNSNQIMTNSKSIATVANHDIIRSTTTNNAIATAASAATGSSSVVDYNVLKIINDHIESFPKTVLHHDNKILYCLDSTNLTTKKMYELFRKKYPGLNISYPFYSLCFMENFTSNLDLSDQNFDVDNIYEVASHFLCG